MATAGLNCLIVDKAVINRIKQSLDNIANSMILADSNVVVTAKTLFNKMKAAGIDIDLQSVASIYSDVFADSIGVHKNFETYSELEAYKLVATPLNKSVKDILIAAGFSKELKNGNVILDWTKLMRKSQDEINKEVREAIIKSMPEATPQTVIDDVVEQALKGLKSGWKQILSNAIIKQQKKLRVRDNAVTKEQKNAVDKISDLYAEGLFDEFKDDYKNAMRKAVGVSGSDITTMALLDDLAKTANFMATSPYGTNNHLGTILQHKATAIIAQAKYEDANWVLKITQNIKGLFDFVLLKILNNPFNRLENYMSGAAGSLFGKNTYGTPEREIMELRSAVKRDIIRNGGNDFGEVNNLLQGDRNAIDKVREKLSKLLTGDDNNKATNWVYAQVMGTASLNAVDSYRKVSNTWIRFVSAMESILVSKGLTKDEAKKQLHEQLFGKDKWKNATVKANDFIDEANKKGGYKIVKNEETIKRFAADIIKTELVESKLITNDEMQGAWNAGYKSAGREMGHVANNALTKGLTALKQKTGDEIDKSVKNKKYNAAALLILTDVVLNKIALKFLGGGTNWVILKLEKGGLGIVTGGLSRLRYSSSFSNKNIADLSPKEMEQAIYEIQKSNDKLTRGTIGLITNVVLTTLIVGYLSKGDDDEEKRRKKRLLEWLDKHYQVQKLITKAAPLWIAAYLAKMQQDRVSWNKLDDVFKKQPAVTYLQNLVNVNPEYSLFNQGIKSIPAFSEPVSEKDYNNQINSKGKVINHRKSYSDYLESEEKNQTSASENIGKLLGNYLDLNPLPTSMIKGGINIYKDITGQTAEYKKLEYENKKNAILAGYFKSGIFEGIIKPKTATK